MRISMTENERLAFGLVFEKTGSINSGTGGFQTDITQAKSKNRFRSQ
jgi:hypothetical protein